MKSSTDKCQCLRCKDCDEFRQINRKVCCKCRDGRCRCQYCGQERKKKDNNITNPRCDCCKKIKKNNTNNIKENSNIKKNKKVNKNINHKIDKDIFVALILIKLSES